MLPLLENAFDVVQRDTAAVSIEFHAVAHGYAAHLFLPRAVRWPPPCCHGLRSPGIHSCRPAPSRQRRSCRPIRTSWCPRHAGRAPYGRTTAPFASAITTPTLVAASFTSRAPIALLPAAESEGVDPAA